MEDVGGQGELRLPVALKAHDQEANAVLEWVASQHHRRLLWEPTRGAQSAAVTRNTIATIRPGDVGETLISGTVFKQVNRAHITGAITAFNNENQVYTITFQNGNVEKWELAQVCASWAHSPRPHWTKQDQVALSEQVSQVIAEKKVTLTRRLRTPFSTMLVSDTWQEDATWYTCQVRWSFARGVRELLQRTGLKQDRLIAKELLDTGAVFLAPKHT